MRCPGCTTELKITDRQGVEIDYCPNCRGVWLERGELDKLLERARSAGDGRYERDDHDDFPRGDRGHDPRRRRKSWLSELLDFD
jgi:Zn-finger nucleic acid-binding protein